MIAEKKKVSIAHLWSKIVNYKSGLVKISLIYKVATFIYML